MIRMMRQIGMSSRTMYLAGFASIAVSIGVWFLRKEDDRANAERLGIFIGLWAPTFIQLGKVIEDDERDKPELQEVA